MEVATDIKYVGVNDFQIDLFEGMYRVPEGMAYNSYVIMDEKIAIVDTVDAAFAEEWLKKIEVVLGERKPDYLIVQHMEPDHSANIMKLVEIYPEIIPVSSTRAFVMMQHFFGTEFTEQRIVVNDGDILSLGKHKLKFFAAPMVHWPEVIMTYDITDKVLFSADAFGKFGALESVDEDSQNNLRGAEIGMEVSKWAPEAARYYFGIVGKYGVYVQKLLGKIGSLEIKQICPLHGPVLQENIESYVRLYHTWSNYVPEKEGVVIAYTSVYGNTKKAVELLADKLQDAGCEKVIVHDLARCDMIEAVADAFRYDKLVLATTTYNADIFPFMREFIAYLTERNFANKKIAFMENGGWAPIAAKIMRERLDKCKNLMFVEPGVRIISVVNAENLREMALMVKGLLEDSIIDNELQ